ncbi:Tim10/DDP family zinc finger-domain-containing protein [Vararia minispora EC-137]|uniref:Tim10/DDP family zinc finger-domain-containing protein n=1 Tax=Vararia minispora EC-137 TaxID=1314806 RepID=A0ACB8QSQ2_9AGAM|nr:Tim10/DDP family zinc finger-domain-containing protein [Vararia minispora EC-137]
MSFFGGSRNGGGLNNERIEAAMHEMEMITDVFNRMVSSCHAKCVNTRYADAELSKGESVCVDRCIGKYFEANKLVGETLNSTAQAAGGGGMGSSPMGM